MSSPDPWTSFLQWLESFIVPDWNAVMSMLPLLMILGVVGPILSLMVLMQLTYMARRRRGRVRLGEPEPTAAQIDMDGEPIFPANVPFCESHAVIYPGATARCEVDGADLSVRCPVDGTTRPASQQLCRACGTRYVLGASQAPVVVRRSGRPPQGGAAVA